MMRNIYQSCVELLVWLGEQDNSAKYELKVIRLVTGAISFENIQGTSLGELRSMNFSANTSCHDRVVADVDAYPKSSSAAISNEFRFYRK
jgi:hypothetical protein